jgi:outer membrane protein assembly factor BamB
MSNQPLHPFAKEFIVAEHDVRHNRVVHVSAAGQLLHEFKIEYPLDLQLLPGRHLLLSSNHALVELDADFRELWRYSHKRVAIFSCQKSAMGNVIFGDASKATICEINPAGQLVREFDFPLASAPHEYLHACRLIRQLPGDRLLVAAYEAKKLLELDWTGTVHHQVDLPGSPYMPIRLPDGATLVSLGPSGLIVEVDAAGQTTWQYDMTADTGLECGWIAGISVLANGHIVYSDSSCDRLVEINRRKELVAIYQDRNILLHPSTHIIL